MAAFHWPINARHTGSALRRSGPWLGWLVLCFATAQVGFLGLMALWPAANSPQAALQVAEVRGDLWFRSGFATLATIALPLLALHMLALRGWLARLCAALGLAATGLLGWLMAGEAMALLPLYDAPLQLARALMAARLQSLALALLALGALIVAARADALA
ncbi:hypothetical protein [Phaeovulum sp.]|uniref:hypothetical protein n=1 Tax=Phaeovulum sp. TaxID=2934796 RepID=UPI003567B60E